MSKERSKVVDYSVYLVVRFIFCLIQALSYESASRLAHTLAWVVFHLNKRHRQVAIDNLKHAFPEKYVDGVPLDVILGIYRHFCNLLVEIIHLPRRLHATTWRRYLDLKDGRHFVDALLSGRPVLLLTGHFGNWEVGGYALALLGFKTHAIARPLDNPYCNDFLRQFRERTGQGLIAKKGAFEEMKKLIERNGVLATLADQDAGHKGLFVDYFGRPASSHKGFALLALEYQVPMIVMGVRKIGEPLKFQTVLADVIRPEEYAGRADAIKAITQRYAHSLEKVVRSAPEQYFWLHRRWKHQPEQRIPKAA